MKKENGDYKRIKNLIEFDRLEMGKGCSDVVLNDLTDILNEYFELLGIPKINILMDKRNYVINIEAKASRVKGFTVLPKNMVN